MPIPKSPAHRMAATLCAAVLALALSSCLGEDAPLQGEPVPTTSARSGCGGPAAFDVGTSQFHLQFAKTERSFLIHAPKAIEQGKPLPLVLALHGLGSKPSWLLTITGLGDLAEQRGFIVVAPQGSGQPSSWDLSASGTDKTSDLEFLSQVIDEVRAMGCIDDERMYSLGFSNGSAMTALLICRTDLKFAAVGGVSALPPPSKCTNDRALPMIYFHGMADEIVPYEGGNSPIGDLGDVETNLAKWAARAGCDPTPVSQGMFGNTVRQDWQHCRNDIGLTAYGIEQWGHKWPHGDGKTNAIDAALLMWDFFVQQSTKAAEHERR